MRCEQAKLNGHLSVNKQNRIAFGVKSIIG
ncbi:hypothetical protein F383_31601 [Gossypium arboreum]|uniref:Uncharacterized protein n=1 Tax=Gossypium arboreum TaxID=29729 RepID=A0A0B0MZE2_GOSAR|nr:hypothetical protein F383_31601 [Gossypium arboreum]